MTLRLNHEMEPTALSSSEFSAMAEKIATHGDYYRKHAEH